VFKSAVKAAIKKQVEGGNFQDHIPKTMAVSDALKKTDLASINVRFRVHRSRIAASNEDFENVHFTLSHFWCEIGSRNPHQRRRSLSFGREDNPRQRNGEKPSGKKWQHLLRRSSSRYV
jgi:hypothetical protein